MTRAALLRSWLVAPPLDGRWLAGWMIAALPFAMLLDATMDCPDNLGECCTPFFMFVLLTSILFGWRAGIISALASALASNWMHWPHHVRMQMGEREAGGWMLFVVTCAALIASVELVRVAISRFARVSHPNEWSSGIIFSLEQGQAWASWPGQPLPVRLGPQQEVAGMMEDFLRQIELARRLGRSASSTLGRESVPVGWKADIRENHNSG